MCLTKLGSELRKGQQVGRKDSFSVGGKEVLIKAVVQAVSAYPVSLFKLSVGLCQDIEKLTADF